MALPANMKDAFASAAKSINTAAKAASNASKTKNMADKAKKTLSDVATKSVTSPEEMSSATGMNAPKGGNTRGISADVNAANIWQHAPGPVGTAAQILIPGKEWESWATQRYHDEIANPKTYESPLDKWAKEYDGAFGNAFSNALTDQANADNIDTEKARGIYGDALAANGGTSNTPVPWLDEILDQYHGGALPKSMATYAYEDMYDQGLNPNAFMLTSLDKLGTNLGTKSASAGSQQGSNFGDGLWINNWGDVVNQDFYNDPEFRNYVTAYDKPWNNETDLRAYGTAQDYLNYSDMNDNFLYKKFAGEAYDKAVADAKKNGDWYGMPEIAGIMPLVTTARDWKDGDPLGKYVNPWWTKNEETYDIRNIATDRDTYDTLMGNNALTLDDMVEWLTADNYGENGELYNWASAVIPGYLESIGAYNPDSDSLDMLNKMHDSDREARRQDIANALFMQRMNQLLESQSSDSLSVDDEALFNMINQRAGGGYRTGSSSYIGGTKLSPAPKSMNVDNWGFDDMYDNLSNQQTFDKLVARDLMNIYDYTDGTNPYMNEQIYKERGY